SMPPRLLSWEGARPGAVTVAAMAHSDVTSVAKTAAANSQPRIRRAARRKLSYPGDGSWHLYRAAARAAAAAAERQRVAKDAMGTVEEQSFLRLAMFGLSYSQPQQGYDIGVAG